ncbi:MAG: hypothetical protein JWO05_1704 [Gemmatimonadetes bacterium]|nr:hypothetical protein [Gemmatimonadota bacterium]
MRTPIPLRGLMFRLLLSLLLLFAQQQAVLHELQHDFDAVAHKSSSGAPHSEVCAKCVFFAQLDHAAGSSIAVPPPGHGGHAPAPAAAFTSAYSAVPAAYLSRGPPSHS